MKRMSEVFELPLSTTFNFGHEWTAEDESEGICLSGFNPIASGDKVVLLAVASSEAFCNIDHAIDNISDCAVHAINHVDALADALQNIINDYERYIALYPPDLEDDDNARIAILMQLGKIALSNYQEEAA